MYFHSRQDALEADQIAALGCVICDWYSRALIIFNDVSSCIAQLPGSELYRLDYDCYMIEFRATDRRLLWNGTRSLDYPSKYTASWID